MNDERRRLARLAKDLGRRALTDLGPVVTPDTLFAWYRKLIAEKFDSSKNRRGPGRPRIGEDIEALVLRFAQENSDWGYDRIAGAIQNLGYEISDETVGNILKRHGISPSRRRKGGMSWAECLSKLILLGERSLENALKQYLEHYHHERNHQGLDNVIPFTNKDLGGEAGKSGPVQRHDRLGGLLRFYYRKVA